MRRKIISIDFLGINPLDITYRLSKTSINSLSEGIKRASVHEAIYVGLVHKGLVMVGHENEFFHADVCNIFRDVFRTNEAIGETFFFDLMYSASAINSEHLKALLDNGGYLIGNDGWSVLPFSSKNHELYQMAIVPPQYMDLLKSQIVRDRELFLIQR